MSGLRRKSAVAAALAAMALALAAPACAGSYEDARERAPLVLNGRINTSDFTGGVGAGQYADDCCYYGGGYGGYAMGGAGAMHAASSFAFMRAHAFASAFAQAHAFARAGGMGHGHR